MKISGRAREIIDAIGSQEPRLGELRKIAREVKTDHELARELWSTGTFHVRQLSILIMDKKELSQDAVDVLTRDMLEHELDERTQLMDWLMANQLLKDKKLTGLVESWGSSSCLLQRRAFWYHQARLRWTGKAPPANTEKLVSAIESGLEKEEPDVQWAMNFTAGQIGIHEQEFRSRCIAIGEKSGLYKDEPVSRGCTPNYLPDFIAIEVAKREGG